MVAGCPKHPVPPLYRRWGFTGWVGTDPVGFRRIGIWWAHQDSNLEPRDSRDPAVSGSADYLFTLAAKAAVGCGTLEPVIKGPRRCTGSPQVVSAPSGGAPPAWLRIAAGQLHALPLRFP
jgi:hypothetical protein